MGGLEENSLWLTKQSYKPQYVLKYTNSDIKAIKNI